VGIFSNFFATLKIKSGVKIMQSATETEGENADRLFKQAYSKFEQAIADNSTVLNALHNWGLALHNQAKSNSGQDAESLFNEAYTKYSASLVVEAHSPEILNDWGATLMDHARMYNADPGHLLYEQAKEKFLSAEDLQPGIASYNLACIDSLQNNLEGCHQHLQTALERNALPAVADMKADADLTNASQSEWFPAFIASVRVYD